MTIGSAATQKNVFRIIGDSRDCFYGNLPKASLVGISNPWNA
jgi:hypothetical protein